MPSPNDLISLMQRHQADVWRYLRMLGSDPSQADDLTQDTFLSVMLKPFEHRGRAATGAYLRKVARNRFLNTVRRESRSLPFGSAEEAEFVWLACTPDGRSDVRIEALRECVGELDGRAGKAIKLRYEEERRGNEIAVALDTSEDGVKGLLKRTRSLLRECVERRLKS